MATVLTLTNTSKKKKNPGLTFDFALFKAQQELQNTEKVAVVWQTDLLPAILHHSFNISKAKQ